MSRKLFYLGGLDIRDLHIEVESLARKRMIEVDDYGLFFDLVSNYIRDELLQFSIPARAARTGA
jgi:hypothetical protein